VKAATRILKAAVVQAMAILTGKLFDKAAKRLNKKPK